MANFDRPPVVAGSFYPADSQKLEKTVKKYLENAVPRKEDAIAVVSPHAGYIFSGQVAANAINQINPDKKYENVFIIGSSHYTSFDGASLYNIGDYKIPGATVKVNKEFCTKFINEYHFFQYCRNAHNQEHCIEVQIPFLYHHLKQDFQIVPIVICTNTIATIKQISQALKPYFNSKNAFIFSSDFSHYPPYEDAKEIDRITAGSIIENNPDIFLETIKQNSLKNIENLATSTCGWTNLLTLLYMTQKSEKYSYRIIDYKNSGDSGLVGKEKVVGYFAISVTETQKKFSLTDSEKSFLKKLAESALKTHVKNEKPPAIDKNQLTENIKQNVGAFVTLYKNGQLRGCIGRFMPNSSLYKVVEDMAISASSHDSRFSPVSEDELKDITIEISVLTPLQKISSIDQIEVGRDGIYIVKGSNSGTLLPKVATDNGWSKIEFLEYCSKFKAGIGKDGWKDAELFIYQAIVF